MKPFIKWAGGKRSLMGKILPHVPKNIRTYHEPFVGGGAVFFALRGLNRFGKARLNDANKRLVQTYSAVQKDVEGVIRRLRRMPNDEAFFYKTRQRKLDREVDTSVAAWLIYMNKTCFNGLFRENRAGQFNVPFGHYECPIICDEDTLRAASDSLRGVKLSSTDFLTAAMHAKEGDFVYFDPPFMPRGNREFTSYVGNDFGYEDHVRLRNVARELKAAGVRVLLSNSNTDDVLDLYADGFEHEEVGGRRSIAAGGQSRGDVSDLLIW